MSDIHHYYPNLDATTTTAAANNNNEPLLPPPSSSSNQWYNGTHNITEVTVSVSDPNMILTGVLMALVVTFSLILCYLTFPAVADWLRNNCKACMPAMASPARVQRRYETIEGWLISKVR